MQPKERCLSPVACHRSPFDLRSCGVWCFFLLLLFPLLLVGEKEESSRIVVTAPNLEEIVVALGMEEFLVGVGVQSAHPDLPVVGGLSVDAERVLALHPTHVLTLASQATPSLVESSLIGRFQLLTFPFNTVDDISDATRRLGHLFHREERSRIILRRFAAITPTLPPVRTLYIIWWKPIILSGEGQFPTQILRRLGLKIVTPGGGAFPRIALEEMLALRPELILYANDAGPPPTRIESLSHATFSAVDADLLNRPGPSLLDAATDLTAKLTPILSRQPVQ